MVMNRMGYDLRYTRITNLNRLTSNDFVEVHTLCTRIHLINI